MACSRVQYPPGLAAESLGLLSCLLGFDAVSLRPASHPSSAVLLMVVYDCDIACTQHRTAYIFLP
jgi:hypothetical protein